nr:MAG TPA: hypothetical protein [Caudoviricetes sp.]
MEYNLCKGNLMKNEKVLQYQCKGNLTRGE